ncbi:hypothetical protein AB4Z10_12975 [Bosea sp. RAF48]|uniref:hypothetical protein n=1 Tax=Bosea sp. RAF48 TaxID=3237480 RepID=UPI003F92CAFB
MDAVLEEARRDSRQAIRMVLRNLVVIADDADAASSRGFLRGHFSEGQRRSLRQDEDSSLGSQPR